MYSSFENIWLRNKADFWALLFMLIVLLLTSCENFRKNSRKSFEPEACTCNTNMQSLITEAKWHYYLYSLQFSGKQCNCENLDRLAVNSALFDLTCKRFVITGDTMQIDFLKTFSDSLYACIYLTDSVTIGIGVKNKNLLYIKSVGGDLTAWTIFPENWNEMLVFDSVETIVIHNYPILNKWFKQEAKNRGLFPK